MDANRFQGELFLQISYQLNDDAGNNQATVGAAMKKIIKGALG